MIRGVRQQIDVRRKSRLNLKRRGSGESKIRWNFLALKLSRLPSCPFPRYASYSRVPVKRLNQRVKALPNLRLVRGAFARNELSLTLPLDGPQLINMEFDGGTNRLFNSLLALYLEVCPEKWLRKSEQGDKWNRCLIEGMIVLSETGARDEQTTPP